MKKTIVRKHKRKGRIVRRHSRKIPQRIGTTWIGKNGKYIHGPRRHKPSRYSQFRLGKPTKSGRRPVFGKIKGTNKWEIQSYLSPLNFSFAPFGPKRKGYIMTPLWGGAKVELSPEEKKKFEIKEEKNLGNWTELGLVSPWREQKIKEKEELLKKPLRWDVRMKIIKEKERLEKL